jgi:hypothetical protein
MHHKEAHFATIPKDLLLYAFEPSNAIEKYILIIQTFGENP